MKHRWLFGTNWKMNKNAQEAAEYASILREKLLCMNLADAVQVFVLPPYTSIGIVKQLSGGRFWVGAQNMHWEECGPYTGEISSAMLAELGIDLVQLGHAERREMFHETDSTINKKVLTSLRAGFRPLVCIGETMADREFKVARDTCARQLRIALKDVSVHELERIILAYEPAWAIGVQGLTADPSYIQDMRFHFQTVLEDMFAADLSGRIPILYGGSVNAEDAAELLLSSGMDGLFVGRAALDATAFADLIQSCLLAAGMQS